MIGFTQSQNASCLHDEVLDYQRAEGKSRGAPRWKLGSKYFPNRNQALYDYRIAQRRAVCNRPASVSCHFRVDNLTFGRSR